MDVYLFLGGGIGNNSLSCLILEVLRGNEGPEGPFLGAGSFTNSFLRSLWKKVRHMSWIWSLLRASSVPLVSPICLCPLGVLHSCLRCRKLLGMWWEGVCFPFALHPKTSMMVSSTFTHDQKLSLKFVMCVLQTRQSFRLHGECKRQKDKHKNDGFPVVWKASSLVCADTTMPMENNGPSLPSCSHVQHTGVLHQQLSSHALWCRGLLCNLWRLWGRSWADCAPSVLSYCCRGAGHRMKPDSGSETCRGNPTVMPQTETLYGCCSSPHPPHHTHSSYQKTGVEKNYPGWGQSAHFNAEQGVGWELGCLCRGSAIRLHFSLLDLNSACLQQGGLKLNAAFVKNVE